MIVIAAEVVNQARNGDEEAFNQIVESFQSPVFNLCFRMLSDAKAAEDAAQETFWRAYQALDKYDPQRSFGTWLLSIAAHHCIDQQRKRVLPLADLDGYVEESEPDRNLPHPESVLLVKEAQSQMQTMLATLPEIDRAALIFRYWYEYSEEEISEALGITVSAVKSRLHRARRKLAKVWKSENLAGQPPERMKNGSPAV